MARSPPPSRGQALKVLEGFFDADEQQVQIPQLGGVVFGEIGAQEIAPLAPARPSQPIAVEVVGKGTPSGATAMTTRRHAAGAWARAAPSFISNSSRLSVIIESCLRRAHNHFSCRRRIARSLATRLALSAKT